ncbi:glycosyltransferase [Nannocystis punicea]|uniref:Glycosyltransferase n=1 Tax=Nannocystis punicea TaxID=2995304 RepID=A0ABY7GW57_9BACT|nr:glycosyltransferase [Nannocystis poenicansa]WAS91208.1 glycosyltransferase [Nannocystis poenicansa]
MNGVTTHKVDLHLHSRASNVTDYYAANAFAIPESYSDPRKLYQLLRQRGMSLVTLTDHNSIDGVRELLDAGLADVFISAEMTTTFPEDGCNIHVTVANMTEAQFAEIHRLRSNIYEMIAWIDEQIAGERPGDNKLAYFMTHPLMSTQNRPYGREGALTVQHVERALLLCPCIEVRNGSRTPALNELTAHLVRSLDRATIERMADKHGLLPGGATPWLKALVGGSDDHAGINPGRTWTEFEAVGRVTPDVLVESIRRRETRPGGVHGGPVTLANGLLKLLHDGSVQRSGGGMATLVPVGSPIHSLLRMVFQSELDGPLEQLRLRAKVLLHQLVRVAAGERRGGEPFERVLETEVYALLADAEFRARLAAAERTDDRIFLVVGTLVNRIFARYLDNVRASSRRSFVGALKEAIALLSSNILVSLPYLVSFLQQSSDCMIVKDVRKAFQLVDRPRVVLVTDTLFEINGVSATILRMLREAVRRGIEFTVVTCLSAVEQEERCADPEIAAFIAAGRLKIFTSVATLDFPEYDGLKIRFPPLLDLIKYMQESGFTKLQISTPGTIGLAGLLAAKLLQIETAATYHTSFPEYVENYTRDVSLEALAWRYMILFYHSVDEVLVPSRFIARLLHKRGLRNRKLLILDRWVDTERFHPRHRTRGFWDRFGLVDEDARVKFIYVGRVGVEKNLHLMAEAYRKLRETRADAHLIVVGDGPYRRELERQLEGLPVTFTGFLQGEALSQAIASADVKLFPSTTDTWGNAPLEAQASGLPVIVSDVGGPAELMRDGLTGLKVTGRDVPGLCAAMTVLMDPTTRGAMGKRARALVEANRLDEPFTAILDSEAYRRRLQQQQQQPTAEAPPWACFDLAAPQFETEARA